VTVTGVAVDTVAAVTAKVAEVAPCATVTLVGIVSPAGELDRLTTAPPEGAALVNVTVPVADPPLAIVLGVTATLDRAAPAAVTPPKNRPDTTAFELAPARLVMRRTTWPLIFQTRY